MKNRFVNTLFALVVLLPLLAGCSLSGPQFISPRDGQTFQIEETTRVDFVIKDYDQSVRITFRGQEALADEIDCVGGAGLAYCQKKYNQNYNGSYYYGQTCDVRHPCTVTAIADDGKTKSVITVRFQWGTQNQTTTPGTTTYPPTSYTYPY